jgi:hypothetical protein
MDDDDRANEWRRQRGTFLGITLFGLLAAGIFSFSIIVCGGAAFYAMLVVIGFTTLGALHYVLWGRRLSDEVADERRAEEMRRRLEEEAWPSDEDEPHRYRRF